MRQVDSFKQALPAPFKVSLFGAIGALETDAIIRESVLTQFVCMGKNRVILAQSNLITERQRHQINHTPDTAITRRHDQHKYCSSHLAVCVCMHMRGRSAVVQTVSINNHFPLQDPAHLLNEPPL